jgi:SH3-like domain-containing protein
MKKKFRDATACLTLLAIAGLALALPLPVSGPAKAAIASASAEEAGDGVRLSVRGTGLPVPRFVTLKSSEVNMRAGPGTEYPVLWQYRKKDLPLRVEAEFGVWRKVVDHEDTTGWMHQSVVSLKRHALVTTSSARIYASPDNGAALVAVAERNALLELQSCPTQWCKVAAGDLRGWVARTAIWGLLDGEILD